jgi:hypothetical protein
MSRSRKKNPVFKDSDKDFKKYANKACRNKDLPSGGAYKKAFESYLICDWAYRVVDTADAWYRKALRK